MSKVLINKPQTDAFLIGIDGKPVIASNDYWDKRTVDKLRQAFDYLKEARGIQLNKNKQLPLKPEDEELFQAIGKGIMELAKRFKK